MRHGSLAIDSPDGAGGAPLVVAHRGAWRPAPQNSLEAFEDAVQLRVALLTLALEEREPEMVESVRLEGDSRQGELQAAS